MPLRKKANCDKITISELSKSQISWPIISTNEGEMTTPPRAARHDVPLLTTKLYIPPVRSELVPRPRLIERLNQGPRSGRKLSLVSASAGFGKTTLIAEWGSIRLPCTVSSTTTNVERDRLASGPLCVSQINILSDYKISLFCYTVTCQRIP